MNKMKSNILVSGRPGIGKSTVIKKIIDSLGKERLGGFWSSEIRTDGRRVGFTITTLAGETGVLAHIDYTTGPRVGKYRVNVTDIDTIAVPAMSSARQEGKIIIVDEIASMELYSTLFRREVIHCLDTHQVVGTIQMKRNQFLDTIRTRGDVLLLTLTERNRDNIPLTILKSISS